MEILIGETGVAGQGKFSHKRKNLSNRRHRGTNRRSEGTVERFWSDVTPGDRAVGRTRDPRHPLGVPLLACPPRLENRSIERGGRGTVDRPIP